MVTRKGGTSVMTSDRKTNREILESKISHARSSRKRSIVDSNKTKQKATAKFQTKNLTASYWPTMTTTKDRSKEGYPLKGKKLSSMRMALKYCFVNL